MRRRSGQFHADVGHQRTTDGEVRGVLHWMMTVCETVAAAVGRCPLAAQGREMLSQVLGADDAEDFFQFLERTSFFDRTQSIKQSSAASVELTTVNVYWTLTTVHGYEL